MFLSFPPRYCYIDSILFDATRENESVVARFDPRRRRHDAAAATTKATTTSNKQKGNNRHNLHHLRKMPPMPFKSFISRTSSPDGSNPSLPNAWSNKNIRPQTITRHLILLYCYNVPAMTNIRRIPFTATWHNSKGRPCTLCSPDKRPCPRR